MSEIEREKTELRRRIEGRRMELRLLSDRLTEPVVKIDRILERWLPRGPIEGRLGRTLGALIDPPDPVASRHLDPQIRWGPIVLGVLRGMLSGRKGSRSGQ